MKLTEKQSILFWKKVDKKSESECWNWLAAKCHGYGVFCINTKHNVASRVSFTIHNGDIPAGKDVLHKCDNPSCVNPSHLFLGNDRSNTDDKVSKGRHYHGERVKYSKLKETDVREIRAVYKFRGFPDMNHLAAKYKVSSGAIHSIINRRSWKHVK